MIENIVTYIAMADGISLLSSVKMLPMDDINICTPA